jgi:cation diffusion facilitator CzcD-associated flavoprotein CzcO
MRVAIVGAGFGGIAAAIALAKEGIDDYVVFERFDGVGGVWRQNTYPGAACDVPSCLYSLSYEQRSDWSRSCSPQAEILAYLESLVAGYGIAGRLRAGTEVARADFDRHALRWKIVTDRGDRYEADVLVLACGQLNRPAAPRVAGREEFAGHSFHSAEWDHSYDLRGQRVAVVGTGASAIQFIPEIARDVARLHVFQRSAPWMLPRANPLYPPWARAAIRRTPGLQRLRRLGVRAVMESGIAALTRSQALHATVAASSRAFMRLQLRDPEVRRRARPDYPVGCKRILFSSRYLPALQRPNVELVTEPIERLCPAGIVTTDGQTRAVDCVIYSTGFKAQDFVLPLAVTGLGGRSLVDAWAGGAEAHLGLTVTGFPNMFLLYGPNTNLGVGSIIVMLEAQVGYLVDALRRLRAAGGGALDVLPEAQRASGEALQRRLRESVWTGCRNWYVRPDNGRVTNNWPGSMREYARATRRVRPEDYRWLRPTGGER